MTEKELQKHVIDMAHLFNWTVAHFRSVETKRQGWQTPVQADGAGYNKLSAAQEKWRDVLTAAGEEYHLFNDRDWQAGKIDPVLR
jgi:hypothetical protein